MSNLVCKGIPKPQAPVNSTEWPCQIGFLLPGWTRSWHERLRRFQRKEPWYTLFLLL